MSASQGRGCGEWHNVVQTNRANYARDAHAANLHALSTSRHPSYHPSYLRWLTPEKERGRRMGKARRLKKAYQLPATIMGIPQPRERPVDHPTPRHTCCRLVLRRISIPALTGPSPHVIVYRIEIFRVFPLPSSHFHSSISLSFVNSR
jgi:hypothetical protein